MPRRQVSDTDSDGSDLGSRDCCDFDPDDSVRHSPRGSDGSDHTVFEGCRDYDPEESVHLSPKPKRSRSPVSGRKRENCCQRMEPSPTMLESQSGHQELPHRVFRPRGRGYKDSFWWNDGGKDKGKGKLQWNDFYKGKGKFQWNDFFCGKGKFQWNDGGKNKGKGSFQWNGFDNKGKGKHKGTEHLVVSDDSGKGASFSDNSQQLVPYQLQNLIGGISGNEVFSTMESQGGATSSRGAPPTVASLLDSFFRAVHGITSLCPISSSGSSSSTAVALASLVPAAEQPSLPVQKPLNQSDTK